MNSVIKKCQKVDKELEKSKLKELKILIDLEDCSKEAIYQAIYPFLDDYYFSLEFTEKKLESLKEGGKKSSRKQAIILIEPKQENFTESKKQEIKKQFKNEILYSIIREKISKKNKNIREAIVAQSLLSAVMGIDDSCCELTDLEKETVADFDSERNLDNLNKNKKEVFSLSDTKNDPLGIAVPWEKKFGEEKK